MYHRAQRSEGRHKFPHKIKTTVSGGEHNLDLHLSHEAGRSLSPLLFRNHDAKNSIETLATTKDEVSLKPKKECTTIVHLYIHPNAYLCFILRLKHGYRYLIS